MKDQYRATPRWVKILGVIGVVLLLMLIGLHLSGHGFGGHTMHRGY